MRITIVSDVFPPEPVTSAFIAADIAEELVRRSHEVTVLAPFPNRPAGRLMAGHRRTWRRVEQWRGLRVVRSWHTLSARSTLLSRGAENVSWGISSTHQLLRESRPDVAYMNTWPLFAQWLNSWVLRRRGVPVICAVKDLYPESLANVKGCAHGSRGARLLRSLDTTVYRNCELVVPLNAVAREHLIATRGLPPHKVRAWPDWVDDSRFPGSEADAIAFRRRHVLGDEFLAIYAGALTRSAGLEIHVEAAAQLRHRPDIRIVLVGDGAMREEIEARIQQRGLDNIQVIHPLSPNDVPMVQAAADVLLLSLAPGEGELTTPSKLIFYLFSGRPVLASVDGGHPAERLIEDAGCGITVAAGDALQLALDLQSLADDPTRRTALGRRSRQYAVAHHAKARVLPMVCDAIEEIGRGASRPA